MRVRGLLAALGLGLTLAACASAPAEDGDASPSFDVTIAGNATYSARALRRTIALDLADYADANFEPAYVDDAAFGIAQYHRDRGFPFVEVSYEIGDADGPHDVRFVVVEGPRTELAAVVVEGLGNESELTPQDVGTFFQGPRKGWLGRGAPVFVASRVDGAPRRLRAEYRARGFLDAVIGEPKVTWNEDRTRATVTLEVREGRPYVVTELAAANPGTRELDGWLEIVEELGPRPEGRRWTPRYESDLRGAVLRRANELGHPDAAVSVDAEVDRARAAITITVHLELGPLVTIGAVAFEGAEETRDAFLRSRMRLRPGDTATAPGIRQSLDRLYRTGLFSHVDAELVGEGPERDLQIRVEERESLELFIEPGWGSYELLRVRTGVRERNLFGTGRRLRVEALAAVRALRGVVGLSDPFSFGEELIGDFTIEHEERILPSFESVKTGFGAFLTHEWDAVGRHATSFGYQFRDTRSREIELTNGAIDLESDGTGEFGSEVDLSSLKLTHVLERRDSPLLPRSGYQTKVSLEYGDDHLGSELDFARFDFTWTHSLTLGERDVLATAFRTGVIAPNGDQVVPLQERYFNGGENTVRSFRQDDLGPTDANGRATGGEAFTVFNVEWRHDLTGRDVHAALFADIGNVTLEAEDALELRDMSSAIGVGLRYMLPVGPLRVDAAFNPDRRTGEDEWVVHFSVGLPF